MHQANEVSIAVTNRLIEKHKLLSGWCPSSNCDFGRSIETRVRQLRDSFREGAEISNGFGVWNENQIVAIEAELCGILGMLIGSDSTGWYCFFCGWLEPHEVSSDERCERCGANLPKRTNEG